MRFLVTDVGGQLRHNVVNELSKRGYEAVGTGLLPDSAFKSYMQLDIIDEKALHEWLAFVFS